MERDLIEGYLDELRQLLRLDADHVARIVDETAEHLREARDRRVAAGATADDAARAAVDEFGPPSLVAARFHEAFLAPTLPSRAVAGVSLLGALYYLRFYLFVRHGAGALVGGLILLACAAGALLARRTLSGRRRWFARRGPLLLPAAVQGWLATAAALVADVAIVGWTDADSHSVSDTLIGSFPLLCVVAVALVHVTHASASPRPTG